MDETGVNIACFVDDGIGTTGGFIPSETCLQIEWFIYIYLYLYVKLRSPSNRSLIKKNIYAAIKITISETF